jgi:S-adenosyl-L-methionine hydrolase (adenosine-forming)
LDHYAASLHGVILSRNARIRIVDISHDVPPHDVEHAAFVLLCCFRDFPPGTVHLAVVDPGVGSARRAIAARADGRLFVGPDNGVLSWALEAAGSWEIREIEVPASGRAAISTTFHGRDVFAPVAAALATGLPIEELGRKLTDPVRLGTLRSETLPGGPVLGRVLHVDRFGNCVTSLREGDLELVSRMGWRLSLGGVAVEEVKAHYEAGEGDRPFLILGSTGYLEVSVKRGSAADRLRVMRGAPVLLEPGGRGGAD